MRHRWPLVLALITAPVRAEAPRTWALDTLTGFPVAGVPIGDINRDGFEDQAMAGGQVLRVSLGRGRVIRTDISVLPDVQFSLPPNGMIALSSLVISAGDLDADGFADFALAIDHVDPDHPVGRIEPPFQDYVTVFYGNQNVRELRRWVVSDRAPFTGFGSAMAAGDMNGDRHSDLAIGAPGDPRNPASKGRVVLYLGSAEGLDAREAWVAEGPLGFGSALAALDSDGDGLTDLLVGGPDGIDLYRGHRRQDDLQPDFAPLAAEATRVTNSGVSSAKDLSAAGDLDADGFADALRVDIAANRIELVMGAASPATPQVVMLPLDVWGLTLAPYLPTADKSAAAAGDLDGDGYPDLVFVATTTASDPTEPFAAYTLFGGPDIATATPVRLEGLEGLAAPRGLEALGDLDDDGLGDLRAGNTVAFGRSTTFGSPRVLSPAELSVPGAGASPTEQLRCVGDVDGDGFDDLFAAGVGNRPTCNDCAGFSLLAGTPSGLAPTQFDERGLPGDAFAPQVTRVGDLDADGFDDVLVSLESAPHGLAAHAGRAKMYWGSTAGLVAQTPDKPAWDLYGRGPEARLGRFGSAVGDVDGDGRMELLLATASTVTGVTTELFQMATNATLESVWLADAGLAPAGWILSGWRGVGDIDGDGRPDIGTSMSTAGHTAQQLVIAKGLGGPPIFGLPEAVVLPTPILDDLPTALGDIDRDGRADIAGYAGGLLSRPTLDVYLAFGAEHMVRAELVTLVVSEASIAPEDRLHVSARLLRAGDINGDGRDDFAVAAPYHGPDLGGRFAVFLGGALDPAPAFTRDGAPGDQLGSAATGGCDFDGDGYADLVARRGLPAAPGLVDLYFGNGAFAHRSAFPYAVMAIQPDTLRRLSPGSMSQSRTSFAVRAFGRSPYGPARVRLEVEVKRRDTPFDGKSLVYGDFASAARGTSPLLTMTVKDLAPGMAYHWRARIGYDRTQAPLTSHSRWLRGSLGPVPATVDVRTPPNAGPIATDDGPYYAHAGVVLASPGNLEAPGVLDNDSDLEGDTISAIRVTEPQHGELISFGASGSFFYRAEPGYAGLDHFSYRLVDALGAPSDATATVTLAVGDCDVESCTRGDYFVAVRTTGGLKSIHCWLDAEGQATCETDVDGRLVLGDPVCSRR